ncbi:MAG: hypothetical protein V9G18_22270 [Albidovulum sp.]
MATDTNITLVLTRFPLAVSCVKTGKTTKDACWGRLFVVAGNLASARFDRAGPDRATDGKTVEVTTRAGKRTLHLVAERGEIGAVREFDSLERAGGFVHLEANTDAVPYYPLKTEINFRVRDSFEAGGVKDHNGGRCFRVLKHPNKRSDGVMAGILVHEAPHVGWLTGCIAPGKRQSDRFGDSSRRAMNEIFQMMGGFAADKLARLIVLDKGEKDALKACPKPDRAV